MRVVAKLLSRHGRSDCIDDDLPTLPILLLGDRVVGDQFAEAIQTEKAELWDVAAGAAPGAGPGSRARP